MSRNGKNTKTICQASAYLHAENLKYYTIFRVSLMNNSYIQCCSSNFGFSLQQIYDEVHDAIHPIDPEQDLTWWSIHHGVDTPFSGPIFVACTAEDATSTQSST